MQQLSEQELIEWYKTLNPMETTEAFEVIKEMTKGLDSEIYREAIDIYLVGLDEFRSKYGSRSPKICEERGLDYSAEITARVWWALGEVREVVYARRQG